MTRFSPLVTPLFMLRRRFALDDLLSLRWFMPVFPRRILPVPVDSNLFAAVLHVLSFGTLNTSYLAPSWSRKSFYFSTMGARIMVMVLPSIPADLSPVPTTSSFTTSAIRFSESRANSGCVNSLLLKITVTLTL